MHGITKGAWKQNLALSITTILTFPSFFLVQSSMYLSSAVSQQSHVDGVGAGLTCAWQLLMIFWMNGSMLAEPESGMGGEILTSFLRLHGLVVIFQVSPRLGPQVRQHAPDCSHGDVVLCNLFVVQNGHRSGFGEFGVFLKPFQPSPRDSPAPAVDSCQVPGGDSSPSW